MGIRVLLVGYWLWAGAGAAAQVGRVDTVGGTTYDWQMGGPAYRWLVDAPGYGIPVCWIRSRDTLSAFPDRNTGYNYYDYATRRWLGNDTLDFMNSGTDAFATRAGFGTLDVDPRSWQAVISAHTGIPLRPVLGREVGHGSFVFEYAGGSPKLEGFSRPVTVVDTAGWIQAALFDDTGGKVYHVRSRIWEQWDSARAIAAPEPDPGFPCHHIAASRVNHRVALTWVYTESVPSPGYYRETTDGGCTWPEPQELGWPPAFSGETLPSYHLSGLFPFYDREGRFHIVCAVMPCIRGQCFVAPTELWHWDRENLPQWTRIARAQADPLNLSAPVGFNALLACRPSMGEDRNGGLHVCWEQFDTANVEPGPPARLRADIWWCRDNLDRGASWQQPVRLTEPNTTSKRFPCVIDRMNEDTLRVLYLVDIVAGFFVYGEGPVTRNPLVVQHVPITAGAVAEERYAQYAVRNTPGPTIVRGSLFLPSALLSTRYSLLTPDGRKVMELQPGKNDLRNLAPGVYFVREEGSRGQNVGDSAIRKVVVAD
ncbi:MAG: hypothetical protein ABIL25_01685 [candidate division WOR-3 bacterium]